MARIVAFRSYVLYGSQEDLGHQAFIVALVKRVLRDFHDQHVVITHDVRNARGGNMIRRALAGYLADVSLGRISTATPDLLVITRDTNRVGRSGREREIQQIIEREKYRGLVVLALPNPYIEAWYFADPEALATVFELTQAPVIPRGEPTKERYKQALHAVMRQAGIRAAFAGSEYAEDIVEQMNLYTARRRHTELGHFIDQIRAIVIHWYQR